MPASRDWRRDAEDIREACQKIRRFTAGMCFETFAGDERARDVVVRDLEVIGVAAKHLSMSAPQVARRKLGGMPDIPADGYSGLDVRLVWSMATTKLDELEEAVRRLAW